MPTLDGVKRLMLAVSLLATGAVMSAANLPNRPQQGIDYSAITYEWKDSSGRVCTSTLADKADCYEQIVALFSEVYTNPAVPGFIRDKAYGLPGAVIDEMRDPDVKYAPCTEAPFNMPADMKVQTPKEGATALLVEMVDDYVFDPNRTAEQRIRLMKSVQVLTNQLYIDTNDGSENPGYLFNYVGSLNRFFIVTKGCNRVPSNKPSGFEPLYMMFEEFSPSNNGPIFGAYDRMNSGEQFPVDHNCSSVLRQNHLIAMSEQGINDNHQVNILFYLPDWRFMGDSRVNHSSPEQKYEWYTYYDTDHMPFVFFSKINAAIKEAPRADPDLKSAWVKVEWESTYKEVSKSNVAERFLVYRVVNGVIEPDPVPTSDILLDESMQDSQLLDDGCSLVSQDKEVVVHIKEPMKSIAYDVRYIIKGRRWGSDFEFTESNVVSATIPMAAPSTSDIEVRIGGHGKSEYDDVNERNNYSNPISLLDKNDRDAYMLRRKHLRVKDRDGDGSLFVLRRTVLDANADGKPYDVAYMEVVSEETDQFNQYVYTAEIVYPDGRPSETTRFKSPFNLNDRNLDGEEFVRAVDANHGVLAEFTDVFTADTKEGKQPSDYGYYVEFFHSAVSVHDESGDNQPTVSNMVQVNVPVREIQIGFRPYTDGEVAADRDAAHLLPATLPVVKVGVRSNPNIKEYIITAPEQKNKTIARVVRTATGSFELSALGADGKPVSLGTIPSDNGEKPVVDLLCEVAEGEHVSLTLVYNDGNTYGNRRVVMPAFPTVRIVESVIAKTGDDRDGKIGYGTYIRWNAEGVDGSARDGDSDGFTVHGSRAWVNVNNAGEYEQKFGMDAYGGDESSLPSGSGVSQELIQGFLSHKAESANPVTVDHQVRMYAVIPEKHRVFAGAPVAGAKYAVYDTGKLVTASNHDGIVTGIDSVIGEGDGCEYEYYDLAGRRVGAASLPRGVYIRVRGGKSEKIII